MKLHILELILWPTDETLAPEVVPFRVDKVNVITGWSETGKSAIIAIIDYVLGNDSYAVPIGPIRTTVAWYGLRLETDIGRMRVARRRAEGGDSPNDYEVLTHADGSRAITFRPVRNQHRSQFKGTMDALSGLSTLSLVPDAQPGSRDDQRASFRDMAAFNFLPQHVVANPHTLFFKTDTTDHREKLRRVLPLVLGAKSNDDLFVERRLTVLKAEERRLDAEVRRRRSSVDTWRSQLVGSYLRAQELNLLPPGEPPSDINSAIRALKGVADAPERVLRPPAESNTTAAVDRLERFRREEEMLDRDVGQMRRQLRRLRALSSTVVEYGAELSRERERVKGYDWFTSIVRTEHECPMCGSTQTSVVDALARLREPVEQYEEVYAGTGFARVNLDREAIDLETKLRTAERALYSLRRTRQELELDRQNEVEASAGQRLDQVYMFIGGIKQATASIQEVDGEEGISGRLRELQKEISILEQRLQSRRQQETLEQALRHISGLIQDAAVFMNLGHTEVTPVLDAKELNIRFLPSEERRGDRGQLLWEIGSGANWMGYHLAALLAVHEHVIVERRNENPVPTFIVIDQPSQVYFPSNSFQETVEDEDGAPRRQSDLAKTRKIFEVLARGIVRTPELQVIVLEHADERTWTGLETGVTKVCDWRWSHEKLIPEEWIAGLDRQSPSSSSTL